MSTSLEDLRVGARARVARLEGGLGFQQNALSLGLQVGQVLRKTVHTGTGPILIEVQRRSTALGRGIARRILVDELHDDS